MLTVREDPADAEAQDLTEVLAPMVREAVQNELRRGRTPGGRRQGGRLVEMQMAPDAWGRIVRRMDAWSYARYVDYSLPSGYIRIKTDRGSETLRVDWSTFE